MPKVGGRFRFSILVFLVLLGGFLIYIFFFLKPSNSRNWEVGLERLPDIEINNDLISIKGVRDYKYGGSGLSEANYIDREVKRSDIERVWFVVEPFKIRPFSFFEGVAHTYFVFDLKDEEPIVISVEARRERGEKYDAWQGLFNQYELIYVWGTERDETVKRVVFEKNRLYMYPLTISEDASRKLFLELAKTTKELKTNPRFYNTLLSNCTNELAEAVNRVNQGAIPFDIALFLPGYSNKLLYKIGYIPNSLPIEEIDERYEITDEVRKYYKESEFSRKLREELIGRKRACTPGVQARIWIL